MTLSLHYGACEPSYFPISRVFARTVWNEMKGTRISSFLRLCLVIFIIFFPPPPAYLSLGFVKMAAGSVLGRGLDQSNRFRGLLTMYEEVDSLGECS